jgi:glycosyltransferase involved in cell wall biosynthesis
MALQTLESRFSTHFCTRPACAECHVWQKRMKIGGRFSRMISVIIPTYNEAGDLTATLDSDADSKTIPEVIVVDAGSADGTGDLARRRASCVLFSPRRQRACQMNLGARHAHGGTLLFLHADTRLPASALDRIGSALSNDRVVGGGFARRYDSNSRVLRMTCLLAGLRTRMIGWFLGDQAIFVRRETNPLPAAQSHPDVSR